MTSLVHDLFAAGRQGYGVARSLAIYWGSRSQMRRLRAFYGGFIGPGDLCFDLGAHAGNRSWTFARLGARVVALEPQPAFVRLLRLLARLDRRIAVEPVAVGSAAGHLELMISAATPTVTSASPGFLAAVATVPSFSWVRWDQRVTVPVVTLDDLIARHGDPAFVKIDVEGMEFEVLQGLSRPVAALSFEFIPGHKDAAGRVLARLEELGRYRCNVALGETMRFLFPDWRTPADMRRWLSIRDPHGPSGDIYARLEPAP